MPCSGQSRVSRRHQLSPPFAMCTTPGTPSAARSTTVRSTRRAMRTDPSCSPWLSSRSAGPATAAARGRVGTESRAERAALGVPGVVHMANGGESWWRRLTRDWPEHGVGLSLHGVSVRLALYLIAEPGVNLVDVGTAVQEAVGAAVERILGLEIGEINVYIQDVA